MIDLFGKKPNALGLIHFIGIGGEGMSSLAELLHDWGFQIQGSDTVEGTNVKRLKAKGMKTFVGHNSQHVKKAFRVVVSSAISSNNPEYREAKNSGIRILHRSELLAEIFSETKSIAVSGTHGKTTTTTMVHTLLDAGGLDPSLISGGVSLAHNSNAVSGKGEWLVGEADESDGSFIRYLTDYAVVTNIDADHMVHFGDMDSMRQSYQVFLDKSKGKGALILCADHPETVKLANKYRDSHPVITYGVREKADVMASNIRQVGSKMICDVNVHGDTHTNIQVNVFGKHNVQNAMAAVAIAHDLGIPFDKIHAGLANFKGVRRRFNNIGGGKGVVVIDDYAHHPVEIEATLEAAKEAAGKGQVIAVIQPHRYTRLRDLMDDFAKCTGSADRVIITPVYASGEKPIDEIDHKVLARKMEKVRSGMISSGKVSTVEGAEEFMEMVSKMAKPGDVVVCMGAGNIGRWGSALVKDLAKG